MKSPLINVEQLIELNSKQNVILLDATIDKVNEKIDRNKISLIPDSIFFDIEGSFSEHSSGLPHTMIDPLTFTTLTQQLGINQDSIIVIYDCWGVYSSPRAWWMFRYMGHKATYVLNGGIKAWLDSGNEVVFKHKTPKKAGDFIASPQKSWFKNTEDILEITNNKSSTIIDARGAGRFNGTIAEPRPGVRSGHIPSSTNVPFEQVLNGAFLKSKTELESILASHLDKTNPSVFTCGSGITAAILALAAEEIGKNNIAVYDGSWAEWGANSTLPIE